MYKRQAGLQVIPTQSGQVFRDHKVYPVSYTHLNEHTEFLHLLAQFLDVVADDAVIDVHVSAMVEQVQTCLLYTSKVAIEPKLASCILVVLAGCLTAAFVWFTFICR